MTIYTYWANKNEQEDGTSAIIVQSGEIAIGESGDFTASEFAFLSQHFVLTPGVVTWTRKDFPWTRIDHGFLSPSGGGETPSFALPLDGGNATTSYTNMVDGGNASSTYTLILDGGTA
jgi:hypothetical protein